MYRTLSLLLLGLAVWALTAASPALAEDKKKNKPKPPPAKPGGPAAKNAQHNHKAPPPKHNPHHHPTAGHKHNSTVQVSGRQYDYFFNGWAQIGHTVKLRGSVSFKDKKEDRAMQAGQLVHLFMETAVGSDRFKKVSDGKTNAEGQVYFEFKIPPKTVPGVYKIRAEYPGGARWSPSKSDVRTLEVRREGPGPGG